MLRPRLAPDAVEGAVTEARRWFAERGRSAFTWTVADTAQPSDLVERLLALGLRSDERDAVWAGMVLETEPPPVPGIEVRRVETFEDELAGGEVIGEAFEATEEERAAAMAGLKEQFERAKHELGVTRDGFLAFVDGRVVGSGGARYTPAGVYLAGGSVAPAYRGRGVYRALVRARWEVAVEHGTPALVVQAGKMSRPILERLGFSTVCEIQALTDASGA